MNWWCSTTDEAWTWSWQAYPGVWLFVMTWAVAYAVAVKRLGTLEKPTKKQVYAFATGLLACWIAADWPVGALASGYLLSVHQLQYVLFVMVAPPLILFGTPSPVLASVTQRPAIQPLTTLIEKPVVAILVCNAIVVLTHFPSVVDGLMQYQLGSFVLDMAWLSAGFVLWWPVLQRVPSDRSLTYPARFIYLWVATLIPGIPAAFFFFARFPIYQTYELAPPLGLQTVDDQFVAGIVMKFGSFVIVLIALSILFYKWYAADRSPRHKMVLPKGTAGRRDLYEIN